MVVYYVDASIQVSLALTIRLHGSHVVQRYRSALEVMSQPNPYQYDNAGYLGQERGNATAWMPTEAQAYFKTDGYKSMNAQQQLQYLRSKLPLQLADSLLQLLQGTQVHSTGSVSLANEKYDEQVFSAYKGAYDACNAALRKADKPPIPAKLFLLPRGSPNASCVLQGTWPSTASKPLSNEYQIDGDPGFCIFSLEAVSIELGMHCIGGSQDVFCVDSLPIIMSTSQAGSDLSSARKYVERTWSAEVLAILDDLARHVVTCVCTSRLQILMGRPNVEHFLETAENVDLISFTDVELLQDLGPFQAYLQRDSLASAKRLILPIRHFIALGFGPGWAQDVIRAHDGVWRPFLFALNRTNARTIGEVVDVVRGSVSLDHARRQLKGLEGPRMPKES